MEPSSEQSQPPRSELASEQGRPPEAICSHVVSSRILIGLIVIICTEVFAGSIMPMGLWHPWTLLVTFWLYFAHFFLFTTLAIRTGRTSLSSLYLWGVLFGLYESWITKVIWSGYGGDGHFVLGKIGPYGYSEISMAFMFHPVMAFILPLAITCLLCPPLRRVFPHLAWITGKSKRARFVQIYIVLCFVPTMAMNGGSLYNLAGNLAAVVLALFVLLLVTRVPLAVSDGRPIVAFGRWGFAGLCVYLLLLYGVTYRGLRPECLPSVPVQLFTFVFYAIVIAGLWLHRRREPLAEAEVPVERRERRLVLILFAVMLTLALMGSTIRESKAILIPLSINFMIWGVLGFGLTLLSVGVGVWESRTRGDKLRGPQSHEGNAKELSSDENAKSTPEQ
jgi:hypothetical protein